LDIELQSASETEVVSFSECEQVCKQTFRGSSHRTTRGVQG
jgi:hypothetical protein